MDQRPALERVSAQEQDALSVALWAEVHRLPTRLAELAATLREPVKDARHSSVPPSHTRKATSPTRPPQGTRRAASVGRAGGGRTPLPAPDQVLIAKAKVCCPCGAGVSDAGPSLQAVDDTLERPPVKPMVTRVERDGGRWAGGGQPYVAPGRPGWHRAPPLGRPSSVWRRPGATRPRSVTSACRRSYLRCVAWTAVRAAWPTCSRGSKGVWTIASPTSSPAGAAAA